MIGNDHLNQFFMDNMPAFMIGKMDSFEGTFFNEEREFGIPTCRVAGDPELAGHLLDGVLDRSVDFSYSNELRIDHSIVVPIMFVRPEMDLPIVPILTNCIAPPLPRARRFYEVGRAIRAALEQAPADRRVAFVISGHLSLEVRGPKQFERRLLDPDFDRRAVGWITNGDADGACQEASYESLKRHGNMTHGFLNFILAMGLANAGQPVHAEGVDAGFPAVPFFAWEPVAESKA